MKLINLKKYTPSDYFEGEGVQYFIDEAGNDWYKSLKKFNKKYTLGINTQTGLIMSVSEDASQIYPAGLTIVDIDVLPDKHIDNGKWFFDGKKVVEISASNEELQQALEAKRHRDQRVASEVIAPLQHAVDLGIATEEEAANLKEWQLYSVALMRFRSGEDWPKPPNQT